MLVWIAILRRQVRYIRNRRRGGLRYAWAMPTLLLNLRQTPDDEAEDVRQLLQANAIGFYETPPSRFGISAGAIWLVDEARADEALALLAQYQTQRREAARAAYAQARAEGSAPGFWQQLRREPVRVVSALVVIAALVALCALPYFLLRD
ncbi:MAG: hypothetical protein AMXMBFR59_23850 [Rhodanobacteraceae bacterium]